MALSKDFILSIVSEEDIYNKYFGDFRLKRLYNSPLREDKKPSFNIYRNSSGKLCFKDFGGKQGDCFDFVMEYHGVNFMGALSLIAQDFNIAFENFKEFKPKKKWDDAPFVEIIFSRKEFNYETKPFPEFGEQIEFWEKYGIDINVLEEYHVKNVDWYSFINKKGINIFRRSIPFHPIFLYDYYNDGEALRFYWPKTTIKGNKWCGNTKFVDMFGVKQIKTKVPLCGFLAGQKDVMSLYANTGIRSVSAPSESSEISEDQFMDIAEKSDKQFVLYDNDKAGKKYGQQLAEKFKIPLIDISQITNLKDTSDYFEHIIKNNQEEKLSELIYESIDR